MMPQESMVKNKNPSYQLLGIMLDGINNKLQTISKNIIINKT